MTCNVGIFVFNEVEVLDFAGPYEVFTTASRVHKRGQPGVPDPFTVFTVGRTRDPVRARAGLSVFPDFGFDKHPNIDLLLIPGGIVTAELEKPEVIGWITQTARRARLSASICTGAFLNAAQGEKVAFTEKTGSYIHKGSAKFDVPFTTGKSWQGPPELDDSGKVYEIQVSLPVLYEGKSVGALVVEINATKVEQLVTK